MTHDIEFAQIEQTVLEGLKNGNAALKKMHDALDIDEIERIMDETREGVEKQNEIDAILSGNLTEEDEEAVEAELEEIISVTMPNVPEDQLPEAEPELPQVPTPGNWNKYLKNPNFCIIHFTVDEIEQYRHKDF